MPSLGHTTKRRFYGRVPFFMSLLCRLQDMKNLLVVYSPISSTRLGATVERFFFGNPAKIVFFFSRNGLLPGDLVYHQVVG